MENYRPWLKPLRLFKFVLFQRTLQLAIKDSSDLDSELDEWLQCIKTTCWGNDREILSQPLSVATSENVYEQPEAVRTPETVYILPSSLP